ncbi:hypothetical protein [Actibacterium sp. 188UL27-1]|uniref:hypothetical protein n=1 Tax=Actibacterium sp. 188UL27-1 TaxID=2786961 RepID=UPI00195E8E75|nr:hypothetical protein [Actibacterium sp. 188UL27-1]MBM7069077.1 hypothetical protein [Actibacterium sp. 188UL27-1]
MRLSIKNTLASTANTPFGGWVLVRLKRLLNRLEAVTVYLERQRQTQTTEDLKTKILNERFSDLTVHHGAFIGLRYPGIEATGSALLPKLLGSYEVEIASFIERISQRSYTDIVDIGCAEGYYAVGFGLMFADAQIHAYDVDGGARRLCKSMAEQNDILDRLNLGKFCNPDTLMTLANRPRMLIVADCEGYEAELFTEQTSTALANHDILIECHDFKDPEISARIIHAFETTHHADQIRSQETYIKAHRLAYPEFEGYDYDIRKFMVDEARRHSVVWLLLTSKTPSQAINNSTPKAELFERSV